VHGAAAKVAVQGCDDLLFGGVRIAQAFGAVAGEVWGKVLPLNVSAAIPAVMLDVGFPLEALKGIPILARTASLIAHLREDRAEPLGFYLADHAAEAVSYAPR
jgi:citrate synthase